MGGHGSANQRSSITVGFGVAAGEMAAKLNPKRQSSHKRSSERLRTSRASYFCLSLREEPFILLVAVVEGVLTETLVTAMGCGGVAIVARGERY